MKVSSKCTKDKFSEHSVTLTFQSEEEAYAVYVMFNHCAIVDIARAYNVGCSLVRDHIRDGANYEFNYTDIQTAFNNNINKWNTEDD